MTTALLLGCAVWQTGPSPALRRRVAHAAVLYRQGRFSRIVACGGLGRHPPTEAQMIRTLLLDEGLPDGCILLEDRSTTTAENIAFALPHLDGPEVLIITDWYHGPRARLIARRFGLRARTASPTLTGARFSAQAKAVMREIPAYLAYLMRVRRLPPHDQDPDDDRPVPPRR